MSTHDPVPEFLSGVNAVCNPHNVALQSCDISNIEINNCNNVTIECDNTAVSQVMLCDDDAQLAGIVAAKVTALDNAAQQKLVDALVVSGIPATAATLGTSVMSYIDVRCNPQLVVNQAITIPKVQLNGPNCTNEQILAVNQLQQTSQCALGTLGALFQTAGIAPGQTIAGNTQTPVVTLTPFTVTAIIAGVIVLLVFAILLGIYLRNIKHPPSR